jgi:hypothetical protein
LPPGWERDGIEGGRPTAHGRDGDLVWERTDFGCLLGGSSALLQDGLLLSGKEDAPYCTHLPTVDLERGRLDLLAEDGSLLRRRLFGGDIPGPAAVRGSRAYLSVGRDEVLEALEDNARQISTAIESYAVDNNFYPVAEELEPYLVPTYIHYFPDNPYGGTTAHSSVASPGNYDFFSLPHPQDYALIIWGDLDTPEVVVETGALRSEPDDPHVAALDAAGRKIWSRRIPPTEGLPSAPVVGGDGSILVGLGSGQILALDPGDGSERWRFDAGASVAGPPSVAASGRIHVGTAAGDLVTLDSGGAEVWRRNVGAGIRLSLLVTSDGAVVAACGDGALRAYDAAGTLVWDIPLTTIAIPFTTAPVLAMERVYIARDDGRVYAVGPASSPAPPEDPGNVLRAVAAGKTETRVRWSWSGTAPARASHFHLMRRLDDPAGPATDILPHPFIGDSFTDVSASGRLLFYKLFAVDCAEQTNP